MRRRHLLSALVLLAVGAAVGVRMGSVAAAPIGDAERGALLFARQCSACHQLGVGAVNRVGPQLNRVFGRTAGSVEGYKYSKSMARMGNDGLVWTLDTLDAYVENPRSLVSAPGWPIAA